MRKNKRSSSSSRSRQSAIVPAKSPSDRPDWLPGDWTMELKKRNNSCTSRDRIDRYFICPITGKRLRSKPEVLRYLNNEMVDCFAIESVPCDRPEPRRKAWSMPVVKQLAQVDRSPDGLPEGWIKEVRFRRDGVKTDSYYIDPVNGYGFRSKKDVFRYLENKKVCRIAFRLQRIHTPDAHSLKEGFLPIIELTKSKGKRTVARKRLFTREGPMSNANLEVHFAKSPQQPASSSLCYASANFDVAALETTCLTSPITERWEQKIIKFPTECGPKSEFHVEELQDQTPNKMQCESENRNQSKPSIQLEGERMPSPDANMLDRKQFDISKEQNQPKTTRLQKRKSEKTCAYVVPARTSKRLAGIASDLLFNNNIEKRSIKAKSKKIEQNIQSAVSNGSHEGKIDTTDILGEASQKEQASDPHDLDKNDLYGSDEARGRLENLEPSVEQASQEHEHVDSLTNSTLPFGDSWSDPCLAFAFKTLTSDFSSLEDIAAIQDYFDHQLISSQRSNLSASVSNQSVSDGNRCPLESEKANKDYR